VKLVNYSRCTHHKSPENFPLSLSTTPKQGKKGGEAEEDEEKAFAEIMMPRKHQRAYQVARRGEAKQKDKVDALMAKRRKIEAAHGTATTKRGAGVAGQGKKAGKEGKKGKKGEMK